MTVTAPACYRATHYDLGRVSLAPIPEDARSRLAAGLAAIDPWRRLSHATRVLEAYLGRDDLGAPRHGIWLDGALGGLACVREPWMHGPYLEFLGVLPHVQRQGAGSAVMAWFEREAPAGTANLWILCSDFNHSALTFYAGHGYREAARLPEVALAGTDQILLRKQVAHPG